MTAAGWIRVAMGLGFKRAAGFNEHGGPCAAKARQLVSEWRPSRVAEPSSGVLPPGARLAAIYCNLGGQQPSVGCDVCCAAPVMCLLASDSRKSGGRCPVSAPG